MITASKESYVLWLENAALHRRKGPEAADTNAMLTFSKHLFLTMMTGSVRLKDLLLGDDLKTEGSKVDLPW